MKYLRSSFLFASTGLFLQANLSFAGNIQLNYADLPVQSKAVPSYIGIQHFFNADQRKDVLSLYLKPAVYKGTNLNSAWFSLAVDPSISDESRCYKIESTLLDKIRVVHGNEWHYAQSLQGNQDAAMHHVLKTEVYRLFKSNTCYEAVLGMNSTSRSVMENPNKIKEFNDKNIMNRLGAVFNRLRIGN